MKRVAVVPALAAALVVAGPADGASLPPQACDPGYARANAEVLLAKAADVYPSYYADTAASAEWFIRSRPCKDLTGDGDREMIVELECCTGSSLTPWGIFKHDRGGAWRLVYTSVRDTDRGLRIVGRQIRVRTIAVYDGASTSLYRDRIVRWDGRRFVTRKTKVYRRR